jgi:hypothetical protein
MELDLKFEIATSCRSVILGHLEPDRAYPIFLAEGIHTRYGQSVLVGIMDSPSSSVKVFLLRRYGDVVSDEELEAINTQRVALLMVYKGTCARSNSYILELKIQ